MGNKEAEADLRRIAGQARAKQQEARKAARREETVPRKRTVTATTGASAADRAMLRKKLTTIVTRAELAEVARREHGAGDAPSSSSSSVPRLPVPPYTHDVHIRKEIITVVVTLHGIPGHHINVSETTDKVFVVDTSAHTKKLRLYFPFPSSMVVDSEKSDITFENGLLTAKFPITRMPDDIATAVEQRLQSVKSARALRFRITRDGTMTVRSRSAKISVPESAKKKSAIDAVLPDNKKNRGNDAAAAPAAARDVAEPAKGAPSTPAAKATAAPAGERSSNGSGAKAAAAPAKKPARATPKPKVGTVDDEKAVALRIAASASAKATGSLKERMTRMREEQRRRAARVAKVSSKKTEQKARVERSFQRVIAEKHEQLRKKEALAGPAPKKESSGKAVRFSA